VGVVILSFVLFFVLPIGVLIAVDNEKRLGRAEDRIDRKIKKLEKLELLLKERDEKAIVPKPATDAGGL
jgi:hypothetical protein